MRAPRFHRLLDHPKLIVWGAAAAVFLLVALAALQYRWTGEVSRAERERLRASLQNSARRLEMEFHSDFVRLFGSLQSGPRRMALTRDDLSGRFLRWRETTPHAAVIDAMYLSQDGEGGELLRLNIERAVFEPTRWPPSLERLRARLRVAPRPRLRPGPPGPFGPGPVVDAAAPAVAMPRPPFAAEGPRWIILAIDRNYLAKHYVPGMIRRHFGEDAGASLEALAHPGQSIYQSDPQRRAPDAVVPLMRFRPASGSRQQAAPWALRVWLPGGGADQVVERARIRTLAASFGVLLMLGAGIAVLLLAARHARRLAALQMEFVAGVSHELRTPLAVICSAGDNLADGLVTAGDQIQRYGNLVRTEGRRLSAIIEQILRFASLDCKPLQPQAVDVGAIVDAALAEHQGELSAASIQAGRQVDPAVPAALADVTALTHCLSNLIGNAVKHAGAGGWIGIAAQPAAGGRQVRILVNDRGPGIHPADLPYVFDPFYRGRDAVSGQIRGLGLGLSLVKRIVEAHGGTVSVKSAPGEGAAFEIRLPAARPESA